MQKKGHILLALLLPWVAPLLFAQNNNEIIPLTLLKKGNQVHFKNDEYVLTFNIEQLINPKEYTVNYDSCMWVLLSADTLDFYSTTKRICYLSESSLFKEKVLESVSNGFLQVNTLQEGTRLSSLKLLVEEPIKYTYTGTYYLFTDKKTGNVVYTYHKPFRGCPSF